MRGSRGARRRGSRACRDRAVGVRPDHLPATADGGDVTEVLARAVAGVAGRGEAAVPAPSSTTQMSRSSPPPSQRNRLPAVGLPVISCRPPGKHACVAAPGARRAAGPRGRARRGVDVRDRPAQPAVRAPEGVDAPQVVAPRSGWDGDMPAIGRRWRLLEIGTRIVANFAPSHLPVMFPAESSHHLESAPRSRSAPRLAVPPRRRRDAVAGEPGNSARLTGDRSPGCSRSRTARRPC